MHFCGCGPIAQVPEGFRRAVSYEAQVNWLAGHYAGLTGIVDDWDEIAGKIEDAAGYFEAVEEDVEVAKEAALEAAEAAREAAAAPARRVVAFGDSFGAPAGFPQWPESLASLVPGATVHNFCVGGAAWAYPANSFQAQVATAAASVQDREAVTHVVFVGGRNDAVTSVSTIYEAARATLQAARNAFPRAHVIVAPLNWGYGVGSDKMDLFDYVEAQGVHNAARELGCTVLDYAWLWLKGSEEWTRSGDRMHPSESGGRVIAGYVASAILGGYSPRYASESFQMGSAPTDVSGQVNLSGNTVNLFWNGNVSSATTPVLPRWAWPVHNVSGICYTGSSASNLALVFVNTSGEVSIYGVSQGQNLGGTGCTMSWFV